MAYNNLTTCLTDVGYYDCAEGDEDCFNETFSQCMELYYGCFHGDVECVDMYLCLISCPTGQAGSACYQECLSNGSVEALLTWDNFIACINEPDYFCIDDDEACRQAALDACSEEFSACANGDLTCSETFECLDTCASTDQVCILSCQLHGTKEAQEQFDAIIDCIVEECGDEVTAECESIALEGACLEVSNACLGN
jgi:hypothetical protein